MHFQPGRFEPSSCRPQKYLRLLWRQGSLKAFSLHHIFSGGYSTARCERPNMNLSLSKRLVGATNVMADFSPWFRCILFSNIGHIVVAWHVPGSVDGEDAHCFTSVLHTLLHFLFHSYLVLNYYLLTKYYLLSVLL